MSESIALMIVFCGFAGACTTCASTAAATCSDNYKKMTGQQKAIIQMNPQEIIQSLSGASCSASIIMAIFFALGAIFAAGGAGMTIAGTPVTVLGFLEKIAKGYKI